MDKTIVVELREKRPHPFYGKLVRYTKKLYVHDEKNEAKTGDVVTVEETRPLSRKKRWRIVEIVRRPVGGPTSPSVSGS
jgi:small subunit ribosomal protein S17